MPEAGNHPLFDSHRTANTQMNRIQKRCFIASAGIHLLLLGILLIGPAFLSKKKVVDESPILEFIPVITTYDQKQGGGDPNVKSLPAAQRDPQPAPEPPKPAPKPEKSREPEVVQPEPVKKPVAKSEPQKPKESDSLEVSSKPKKPQPNLTLVKRPTPSNRSNEQAEREAREARNRLARELDRAVSGIKGGLSDSTEIRLKGSGGGGVPYANFYDAVKSVYYRELIKHLPDSVDDSARVEVTVVIAKDGSVVSSRITRRSGIPAADRAVQNTLNSVRFAAPLPSSETLAQREVTITFNISAIRQLLG